MFGPRRSCSPKAYCGQCDCCDGSESLPFHDAEKLPSKINRALHCAELVTDDADALRESLEAATEERVVVFEEIGAEMEEPIIRHKVDFYG